MKAISYEHFIILNNIEINLFWWRIASMTIEKISSKSRYRFSAYGGKYFFKQFFLAREKAILKLEYSLTEREDFLQKNEVEFNYFDSIYNHGRFSINLLNNEAYLPNSVDMNSNFDTKEALRMILHRLNLGDFPLSLQDNNFILQLCKKFNLFGRIATKYSPELKSATDRFDCIQSYALLSLVSLHIFEKNRQYSFFDLSLKINDVIQDFNFSKATMVEKLVAYIALKKELSTSKVFLENINANT